MIKLYKSKEIRQNPCENIFGMIYYLWLNKLDDKEWTCKSTLFFEITSQRLIEIKKER